MEVAGRATQLSAFRGRGQRMRSGSSSSSGRASGSHAPRSMRRMGKSARNYVFSAKPTAAGLVVVAGASLSQAVQGAANRWFGLARRRPGHFEMSDPRRQPGPSSRRRADEEVVAAQALLGATREGRGALELAS